MIILNAAFLVILTYLGRIRDTGAVTLGNLG